MKSRRGGARRPATLKSVVAALGPLVQQLRLLERDARGIETQLDSIPVDADESVEVSLNAGLRSLTKRFASLVGAPPRTVSDKGTAVATSAEVRNLIEAVGRFAAATGADIGDTAPLRFGGKIWTSGDGDVYDAIPNKGGFIKAWSGERIRSRLRLRPELRQVKLDPDGTLPKRFERFLRDGGGKEAVEAEAAQA